MPGPRPVAGHASPLRAGVPGLRRPAARGSATLDALYAGVPAALWSALAGLVVLAVPVLLVWAADGRSGADAVEAVRTAGQAWSLAHGAALRVPGGALGVVPLGLSALLVLLLARAGRHAVEVHPVRSLRAGARLVAALALPYAVVVSVVAAASATTDVGPAPVQALVGGLLLGTAGAALGVGRGARLGPAIWARVPERAQRVLPGASAAVLALLGAGALLVGCALALDLPSAAALSSSLAPGPVGGLGLAVLGLVLVPTAAVWGAAWLTGTGVSVGAGTTVAPLAAQLGPVPALPLLAALPAGELPVWAGALVLAVPLGAGALAGWLVQRRGGGLLDAALTGPAAGAALGLLGLLAGGPAGGGRLAHVGPTAWAFALSTAAAVSAGAVLLVLVCDRVRRRGRPAAPDLPAG